VNVSTDFITLPTGDVERLEVTKRVEGFNTTTRSVLVNELF